MSASSSLSFFFFVVVLLLTLSTLSLFSVCHGSDGDQDPRYRSCVEKCKKSGCINDKCYSSCKLAVNGDNEDKIPKSKCPYDDWIQWDCTNECRYQCMIIRESEKREAGGVPVKYHGKWPVIRMFGLQEPFSVLCSIGNLVVHAYGLSSFIYLVHFRLPKRPQGKRGPYYEYSGLWVLYGLASMNSWFWSALFHARDTTFTEKFDYSSAIALLGVALIIAVIRSFNLRIEAARVMVAAPVIAFVSTHILYLHFYEFDYDWNIKVCVTIGALQLLIWTVWAGYSNHPSKFKLWFVVLSGSLAMLLEIFDFPPIYGYFDAHSIWHAVTIPLMWIWWSFIKDDASFRTNQQLRRTNEGNDSKKVQ